MCYHHGDHHTGNMMINAGKAWAKYSAPAELDSIMGLNRSVLTIFDGMDDPVPKWYRLESE